MTFHAIHTTLVAAVVAGLAAGCGTTGHGSGTLESAAGKQREGEVEFRWTADADATHGTIQAMLPDGRAFAGDFIQITSATIGTDLGVYGGWRGGWYGMSDGNEFIRHYTGRVIAQLSGPNGERMRCRFRLAQPEDGPASGGVGDCELSNGESIDYASLRGERD